MPLGFHPYPGGIIDNSPPFQRWVRRVRNLQAPKGRLKPGDPSAVPSGLAPVARSFPNVETLGYYRMSLRDKDSDTFSKSLLRSNPSGIGSHWFPPSRDYACKSGVRLVFIEVVTGLRTAAVAVMWTGEGVCEFPARIPGNTGQLQ